MISIFDELMTEASNALMESLCRPKAIRIPGNNGFQDLTLNAIVGNHRIDVVSDMDEGEWLAEKISITVKAVDAAGRLRIRCDVYVSGDDTPWSVVSTHNLDRSLIKAELQRRYVFDRSRSRREETQ